MIVNLGGADLRGADLYFARLSDANLRDADLRACLVRVRVKPFLRSLAYAEDPSEGSLC